MQQMPGLTDVKDGSINADFECNPLAAPYVEDIIKKLKDGSQPESKKIYVDESCISLVMIQLQHSRLMKTKKSQ